MKAKQIKIEDIAPPEVTIRTLGDEEALTELRDSIAAQGLIEPLVVRPKGDKYELVAGYRRMVCIQALGWAKVPCVIQDYTDEQAAAVRLHENAHREDVNPVDLARYLQWCMTTFGWVQQQVADHMGKSVPWVSQHLKLLTLDEETKHMVEMGELSARHGYHLAKMDDVRARQGQARRVVEYGLPVAYLEKEIAERQEREYYETHPEARPPTDYVTQPYDRPRSTCFACGRGENEVPILARLVCVECFQAIQAAVQQEKGGE